ncbi:lipase domain-containing protein, putative [Eimeria tenella]|uniref:Lipase domain-containing protein, putative n=1 Tax=Eimeria tenella TaxID=5802 RepID=U6KUQ2_EIMTE|nr:lipase domain-containing protein, putative [Eimeria tenella]CDJ40648.1 lipase domain-containing protein, putative [Eimeria tenella]|eukprot:XP_013231398.1 lipase domain-containing protein, putative [Eimeria tenella]
MRSIRSSIRSIRSSIRSKRDWKKSIRRIGRTLRTWRRSSAAAAQQQQQQQQQELDDHALASPEDIEGVLGSYEKTKKWWHRIVTSNFSPLSNRNSVKCKGAYGPR